VVGAHTLHDGADNYLSKLGVKKGRITAMSADVLRDAIRAGHDGAQRTWHEDGDLSPQQIVDLQQYLPDDVKPLALLVTGNEDDWGYSRRPGESIHDWMQRKAAKTMAVANLAYSRGYRRFTFGNVPMGCHDWTDETTRIEFGNAFRNLYNRQTLDGTPGAPPVEWWFDGHCYVPDLTWLYDSRVVPGVNVASAHTEGRASVIWGDPHNILVGEAHKARDGASFVATYLIPPTKQTATNALPVTGRVIHPWDWYLTRSNFLFWEEMGICFDPTIQRVCGTEGLIDEPGVGGPSAHRYSPRQVQQGIVRMLDILSLPIIVNGKSYAQPHRGFTCFTSSRNDPKWSGGYGIDYVLQSPDADVTQWSRG
jgi:hypothetical protein